MTVVTVVIAARPTASCVVVEVEGTIGVVGVPLALVRESAMVLKKPQEGMVMNLEMVLNRVSLTNYCEDPKLTCCGVGNATGDSASRILPDIQGLPTVPAMNVDLNGTDAPENPREKSVSKRGRVGAGEREKETRGRTGMRDEVAERLRLRTNGPQVVRRDSPTSEDDPAPITVSKRKKPPPPPTM
jgi:hypothetical protein